MKTQSAADSVHVNVATVGAQRQPHASLSTSVNDQRQSSSVQLQRQRLSDSSAQSLQLQRHHQQMKTHADAPIQRRVSDPTGLAAAHDEVKAGARQALIETILDVRRTAGDGPDWVDNTLLLPGDRGAITALVNALSIPNLIIKINLLRAKYPTEQFDSTNFDTKPADGTPENAYVQALVAATIAKMGEAEANEVALKNVFGDGDVTSAATATAAGTARGKIAAARVRLTAFNNIFIDTAGVARRVGIGGYANFDRKIFLLVKDAIDAATSSAAIATLFHETMHVTHAEILDAGGYTSAGASYRERSVAAKLRNADHYAEIARIIDGNSGHPVPFTPVAAGAAGGALTNAADTPQTMAVRSNVIHRGRLLWSGAADLFMASVRNKRASSTTGASNASRQLNMTYHNAPWYRWPDLNEVDLSLAEASVNRIHRFTASASSYVQNAADANYTFIHDRYVAATGAGAAKEQAAGKEVLVDLGIASPILSPQDKLPSVRQRIDDMSRAG